MMNGSASVQYSGKLLEMTIAAKTATMISAAPAGIWMTGFMVGRILTE